MAAFQMTSISHMPKSHFLHHTSIAPPIIIVRSTRLSRRCRYQQQTRSFRIGLWSSYLDPAFQKELQRRHRVIKHKYAEALSRKLSWDRRLPAYATRWSLKGLMCSSWRGHDPRPGGRWVNVDEVKEVKDNFKTATSYGIEEVEQDALNDLLWRRDTPRSNRYDGSYCWDWIASDTTVVHPDVMRHGKERESRQSREPESRHDRPQGRKADHPQQEQEYFIDPITNRKVFGKIDSQPETKTWRSESHMTEIPVKTFKSYRSQFSQFEPPNAKTGDTITHPDNSQTSGAVRRGKSMVQNVQDEVGKYNLYKYNEPDGKPSYPKGDAKDKLREHDHLYKPFKYNEPDGKLAEKPDCVKQSLNDFDHPYKPFKYNEPDGQFPEQSDSVEKSLKDYDYPMEYEPLYPATDIPTDVNGRQSHHASDTIQGSWVSHEVSSSQAGLSGRDREVKTPKQKQAIAVQPSSNRPPNFRPSTSNQADVNEQEDLDLLRASDIRAASGTLKAPKEETENEQEQHRAELEKGFDQIQVRASYLAEEIAASLKVKESRQLAQDFNLERSYLLNHNAHARGRVNAKIAELDAEMAAEKAHSDAQRKTTGNFVRDFPEEFSASWTKKGSSANSCLLPSNDTDAWGYDKSPKGLEVSYQQEVENDAQSAENDYAADCATENALGSTKLETALHRSLTASENKAAVEHDPYTKEPQGLETSYAKEVQEQGNSESRLFTKSYGCKTKRQEVKELVRSIRDIYESTYGTIDCKHRQIQENQREQESSKQNGKIEENQTQTNIQNLERQVRESQYQIQDHYMDVAKAFTRQAATKERDVVFTGESTSATKKPQVAASSRVSTLYKILSYEPSMKTIEMAETTSMAPVTSSALTPAQVLLRLSHPAKFFPYFQPLQSQGFEIASGNGNTLVFRKVREGIPSASPMPNNRNVVNPIDGMQSMAQPTAGNFASPTGFVSHNLPTDHTFVSGIDVRREEPVFSGRRTKWQESDGNQEPSETRSKKVGRGLLIGAAWVAACSYAVGVVAEYFTTGGSDGKGPVGF